MGEYLSASYKEREKWWQDQTLIDINTIVVAVNAMAEAAVSAIQGIEHDSLEIDGRTVMFTQEPKKKNG